MVKKTREEVIKEVVEILIDEIYLPGDTADAVDWDEMEKRFTGVIDERVKEFKEDKSNV
jgi:hypothetical protein